MSNERPSNAPTPPPRDLAREARRLARIRRLRLVTNESIADGVPPTPDPKQAA